MSMQERDTGMKWTLERARRKALNYATLTLLALGLHSLSGCGSSSDSDGKSKKEESAEPSKKEDPSEGETGHAGTPSTPPESTPDATKVPKKLPKATGPCPEFAPGNVEFAPSGLKKKRKVVMWLSDRSKELDGPLLFYWHGANGSPTNAPRGLGPMIQSVMDLGGVVVAPYHDPDAGAFPWFLVSDASGERLDDLILADEVLACAIEKIGVDLSRIHVAGMSAGGLQTAQMSYRRSNYVASVSPYSGGFVEKTPELQDPDNPPASMIFHGGEKDVVVLKFQETSERYLENLRKDKGFGFICDHGQGHRGPIEALEYVWEFFEAHPYKVSPKPYADKLPKDFPDYCKLP